MIRKIFKSLYTTARLYWVFAALVVIFVVGNFVPFFFLTGKIIFLFFIAALFIDMLLLYGRGEKIMARRQSADKFSNGDDNPVKIFIKNNYPFNVSLLVIDEIPFQFQNRNFKIKAKFATSAEQTIEYKLKPVVRGEYIFGALNIFASSPINLFCRRFQFSAEKMVPVYPSFLQMRKYELIAISNRLSDYGIKKIRRLSNNNEFEKIREYISGDDYRTINWKATARKAQLMVNQYQDERSQHVYSLLDMGRNMKMPFEGMSLLDYSINAALVISNIAMIKYDKAGLLTFSNKINSFIAPNRNNISQIQEGLYKLQSNFLEPDYEALCVTVHRKLNQRSLLLLYTNFEALPNLKIRLKYLQLLAKKHLLVVIFFENTEIKKVVNSSPASVEEIYRKTMAEKFSFEKRQIVKELNKFGIQSILTEPKNLTINTINKYLELKSRGLI